MAMARPARPAPVSWTWFKLAAPVGLELAAEPDAPLEPVGSEDPVPEAAREAPLNRVRIVISSINCNHGDIGYLPDEAAAPAEPVADAALLAAPEGAAGAPTPAVWVLGKKLAMQAWTHWLNFSVAAGDPSPWSHLLAHSFVSTAWEELGRAMPKHEAWQVTSAGSQLSAQLT